MHYPLYILSKGRWDTANTPRLLEEVNYPYYLVVEEQEYEQYKKNYPKALFLILPKPNQGVSYVRQWILEFAYQNGGNWYWMLDDDIKAFYYREGTKVICADASVLSLSEHLLNAFEDVAQVALHKKEFAWRSTKPFVWNTYCNNVVANHAQRLYPCAAYREGVQEDIDMTLQALAAGYRVIRIEQYFYDMPDCGTNRGGLYEEYARKDFTQWSEKMMRLWGPEIVRIETDSAGDSTIVPNWRYFRKVHQP